MGRAQRARPWKFPPRRIVAWAFLAVFATALACDRARSAPAPSLEPDDAARVGADHVKVATVLRIAESRGVSRKEATDLAVRDALLGAAHSARFEPRDVKRVERSAGARAMLEDLVRAARASGPITDAELDGAIRSQWWEFDRPRMLRTSHAVVLVKKPEELPAAKEVADRILEAVQNAPDASAFERSARTVPAEGLEVRVEALEPVAADGRALDPEVQHPPGFVGTSYDPEYVRGAFAIDAVRTSRGSRTSPVVKTQFGYHVIFLASDIAELHVPRSEARERLEREVLSGRARARFDALRERLRASGPIEIDRAALELMAKVQVVP